MIAFVFVRGVSSHLTNRILWKEVLWKEVLYKTTMEESIVKGSIVEDVLVEERVEGESIMEGKFVEGRVMEWKGKRGAGCLLLHGAEYFLIVYYPLTPYPTFTPLARQS